jgi:predicted Rossmann-fold nucleotide-binding protein
MTMQRICVFCGSSPGANTAYLDSARALGQALVQNHTALVTAARFRSWEPRAVLAAGGGTGSPEGCGQVIAFTGLI